MFHFLYLLCRFSLYGKQKRMDGCHGNRAWNRKNKHGIFRLVLNYIQTQNIKEFWGGHESPSAWFLQIAVLNFYPWGVVGPFSGLRDWPFYSAGIRDRPLSGSGIGILIFRESGLRNLISWEFGIWHFFLGIPGSDPLLPTLIDLWNVSCKTSILWVLLKQYKSPTDSENQ